MAYNHEQLSDFEVVTAEWAQEHLMDQVIVKADTVGDLASIPTAVKTAYVLAEGQMYIRDDLNNWKRGGGAAEVSETEPTNPATGQLWVKPSEVLPVPVRAMPVTSSQNITTDSWVAKGTSVAFTTPGPVMVMVTYTALPSAGASSQIRGRLAWTGATTGDSYTQMNGWAGTLNSVTDAHRMHSTIVFPVVCNTGTTYFHSQWRRSAGTTTGTTADVGVTITPVAWADQYADGVT